MESHIGLMGGTFDPIHNAHLAIARAAFETFSLCEVLFIPTGDPPHKDSRTNKHHRLRMVELAVAGQSGFSVSPIEVRREGTTYTVDTLRTLTAYYANADKPGKFDYIVGADTLMDLFTWRRIDEVMMLCDLIAFHRKSVAAEEVRAQSDWLMKRFGKTPRLLPVSAPDISSTEVRTRLSGGEPVTDLIPAVVLDYIKQHHLYAR